MSNEPRDTHPAPFEDGFPTEHSADREPPTNRGKDLMPGFMGNPAPVPPPGADQASDLGGLIARMEATLDDIEGAAAKLDLSSKLFVGQARTFHQEVRLWMNRMEDRVVALEEWRKATEPTV